MYEYSYWHDHYWYTGIFFNIIFLSLTMLVMLGITYSIQCSLKSPIEGPKRRDLAMDILKSGKKSVKSGKQPFTFHGL